MRTDSLRTRILAAGASLLAGAALAQSPAPPAAVAPPAAEEEPGALLLPQETGGSDETIKAIIAQELDPSAGTYSSGGRRDPFVSLIKGFQGEGTARTRKAGLEAFLIQEVALKGVVKTPEGFVAMVLGTDGKSYFPRVGARLFDGQIVSIDQISVTFRQEITDPLSPVRTRDVKKSLYPSEEMRQ